MRTTNKRGDIMEATMRIVAEEGLTAMSTRSAAKRASVSDGLMYRFFESKDELLYSCFEEVHKEIAALFTDLPQQVDEQMIAGLSQKQRLYMVRNVWMTYFHFLIQNDYRTLFYFEYRNSSYIKQIRAKDKEARDTYFKGFADVMEIAEKIFGIQDRISSEIWWSYILDTSGIFAGRIIRGEIENNEKSIEQIWKIMSGGIAGFVMASPEN